MAKVLVIDDMETDRRLLGGLLETMGHSVEYANDGKSAVPRAKEVMPAIIFLDIVMKDINGFEALDDLMDDAVTKKIPVVMVTSKSLKTDQSLAMTSGAKAYVVKPATEELIQAAMRHANVS